MSALAAVSGGILTAAAIGFHVWPMLGAAGFFFVMAIVIEVGDLANALRGSRIRGVQRE
jgi:hypothetical protein